MAQQTNHIGDVNKMVEYHIVDTNKIMTALDWFVKEIQTRLINHGEVNYVELAKQAKAMEKEQIINAFDNGCINEDLIGKEYYNETYNK